MIEAAIEIAVKAHKGQTDKAGAPYILHPLRLMMQFDDVVLKCIAVMHDVIEDSDFAPEDLREAGISNAVIDGVLTLTHRDGEAYDDYITRIMAHPHARKVKMADIKDNMDITRIADLREKDLKRLEKYHRSLKRLIAAEASQNGSNYA